ncbi:MAG: ABC transporter ATP-binding protein [Actinomycetes bacterium]
MPDEEPRRTASRDLRLERVTKRFGRFVAVDDLTLTVPAGSFFALLGPSGCGKTTTLRMVGGLEQPNEGHILLGEEDITALRPYKRPVNTVFQSYALFPHLDVAENVAFGLRRRRVDDVRGRVERVLELVQLGGFGRRRPAQLSGGQQQRVALARALVNEPEVLLLDEPLGALDLKLRRQMQLELKRIQTDVGITFVHVTHDQEEAMTMADTIAVMRAGQVEQLGTPEELYERPATAYVANFLGQSNMLEVTVLEPAVDGTEVEVGGVRLVVPGRHGPRGARLHVGVRPEKVSMSVAGADTARLGNTLPATVTDVVFTGLSTQYVVKTPWDQELVVFEQNAGADDRPRPGTAVVVAWQVAHTFVLDDGDAAETDARDLAATAP